MRKPVLFIHGGGEDGYESDAKLAASLQSSLGKTYYVRYPQMPSDDSLPDFGWLERIGNEISSSQDQLILAGHSLGASMILKYLSENRVVNNILGIFLIASPYWSGEENWKQGLKLNPNFADKLPQHIPVFLYQSTDDEVVPIEHLEFYSKKLPHATVRVTESGGHQFNNDLILVANDIKSL